MSSSTQHYRRPGPFTQKLLNPFVAFVTRRGSGLWGSRVLEVRGRKTGELRRTPVNVLSYEGRDYLVAPRGDTQWVRNVRADEGRLTLVRGRSRAERVATELADSEKPPVLRAYLRRWRWEVGVFFDGVKADSPDEELRRIAPRHPVFALAAAPGATS